MDDTNQERYILHLLGVTDMDDIQRVFENARNIE